MITIATVKNRFGPEIYLIKDKASYNAETSEIDGENTLTGYSTSLANDLQQVSHEVGKKWLLMKFNTIKQVGIPTESLNV